MYLFGIVGMLVAVDIVFLIPVTMVSEARLTREYEEIEGNDVSVMISYLLHLYIYCVKHCVIG